MIGREYGEKKDTFGKMANSLYDQEYGWFENY
jgi:hypothetical protein